MLTLGKWIKDIHDNIFKSKALIGQPGLWQHALCPQPSCNVRADKSKDMQ